MNSKVNWELVAGAFLCGVGYGAGVGVIICALYLLDKFLA